MSKQRPSIRPCGSWRERVFKNTFTRDGKLKRVKGWSVKIQHKRLRRTISLHGHTRTAAALEAEAFHEVLLRQGWKEALRAHFAQDLQAHRRAFFNDEWPKSDARYWRPRLVHRKHLRCAVEDAAPLWSARIEHDGRSHYFPLRTSDEKAASTRAAEIYRTITATGWEEACRRFSRELTLAFHWASNPVAWTYTTLHTQVDDAVVGPRRDAARSAIRVAVVEAELGLHETLAFYLARLVLTRGFSSAEEALDEISGRRIDFVLVNQALTNMGSNQFADALRSFAPRLPVLVYSTYEDSHQLFSCTPGGAPAYLLKRTPPERLLAPLEPLLAGKDQNPPSEQKISEQVRQYFCQAAMSLQSGQHDSLPGLLTPREKQILDCLSKGYVDKEIANELGISAWTVHGHIKNIFGKLSVHSRTEAVVKYLHK